MFIETIIHAYWERQPELLAILPSEQVLTGPTAVPRLPCLVLTCEKMRSAFRTNRSQGWEKGVLKCELFHDSLDAAQEMLRRIDTHFDGLRLNVGEKNDALRFRRTECVSRRYDNTRWGAVGVYEIVLYPAG